MSNVLVEGPFRAFGWHLCLLGGKVLNLGQQRRKICISGQTDSFLKSDLVFFFSFWTRSRADTGPDQ